MSCHLLIIDALNLIRRVHAAQGSPCLSACLYHLRQIVRQVQPTHAVALFDPPQTEGQWRYRCFPAYKSGRPAMPAELLAELDAIQQMLQQHGIPCWQYAEHEADDVAATLAEKMARAGQCVTIITTDKGYCQLLSPQVQIRDYFQKRWLDAAFIAQTFQVKPHQLPDYWGLAGVASCKIPGVKGIGGKTAAQLLAEYASLERLYQNLDTVAPKWRRLLTGQQAMAYLSRRLATLCRDLHLEGNLRQLRYTPPAPEQA